MKMAELINENPYILLLLEHFEIDFVVSDKTVKQIAGENKIPEWLFLVIANLYNGFHPTSPQNGNEEDILAIIRFLKNSHNFYKSDKYPEIIGYIKDLQKVSDNSEVKLIEKFFISYFDEVLEHLAYEDSVAFPYFLHLAGPGKLPGRKNFSVNDYREHHSDIETKLTDLKNLLLKHLFITDSLPLRRKLLFSLFELEFDLQTHALIEDNILLPIAGEVEKRRKNG
jgi:regulator of cell morphogenesis and NO signaling